MTDKGKLLTILPLTENGLAKRFLKMHGIEVLFAGGTWWVWKDNHFTQESTSVKRRARHTAESILQEIEKGAAYQTTEGIPVSEEDIEKFAYKCNRFSALRSMLDLASTYQAVHAKIENFDSFLDHIACLNGIIDLKTGALLPHSSDYLFTRLVHAEFHPEDEKPSRFLAFLDEITSGDKELQLFLQVLFGYCLTGHTTEQIMLILYGLGSNGKSTLLDVLLQVMGDYGMSTPSSTLIAGYQSRTGNELARLRGARLVSAVETSQGQRFNESLVKQLTGGDPVTARFLFKEFFTFLPQFKLVIAANHLPAIKGADYGIWRRMRVVPFKARFEGTKLNKQLKQQLLEERDGILAWLVEGARRWYKDGLPECDAVTKATAKFQASMDTIKEFLEDKALKTPTGKYTVAQAYEDYRTWASENGDDPMGKKAFGDGLRAKGFKQVKSGSVRFWEGIQPKTGPVPSTTKKSK